MLVTPKSMSDAARSLFTRAASGDLEALNVLREFMGLAANEDLLFSDTTIRRNTYNKPIPFLNLSRDEQLAQYLAYDARLAEIKFPDRMVLLHEHGGGVDDPISLRDRANKLGARGIGKEMDDFISRLKRNPGAEKNLDRYLESVFDVSEGIQSGREQIREAIIVGLRNLHTRSGCINIFANAPSMRHFDITDIELRFNPMKRTGSRLVERKIGTKGDRERFEHEGFTRVSEIIESAQGAIRTYTLANKNVRAGLIFCAGRDLSHRTNMIMAERLCDSWSYNPNFYLAVDIAGPEWKSVLNSDGTFDEKILSERLSEVSEFVNFIRKNSNMKVVIHNGEDPSKTNLDIFCRFLKAAEPARVGHPIVAILAYLKERDARGLNMLKDMGCFVELMPYSNYLTGAYEPEFTKHIFDALDEFKIPWGLSSDSPFLIHDFTPASEYAFLLLSGAITEDRLLQSFEDAKKASFLKDSYTFE